MAQFKRISRQEAIDFLDTSTNWQELRRDNQRIQPASDLSTDVARRYANSLRRIEAQGRWAHNLGELRGHIASEHHRGRGAKPGMENYQRPEKMKRMFWEEMRFAGLDRRGHRVRAEARFTVTAGESVAVRALRLAAKQGMSVQLVLTGPLPGEQKSLFDKGGYDARALLLQAGYSPGRRGAWKYDPKHGPGLERWLREYMARVATSPTKNIWPFIALYQIYAREQINEVDRVALGHQRTYYLPNGARIKEYRPPR